MRSYPTSFIKKVEESEGYILIWEIVGLEHFGVLGIIFVFSFLSYFFEVGISYSIYTL